MRRYAALISIGLAYGTAGCRTRTETPAPAPASDAASAGTSAAAGEPDARGRAAITEADARALLDAWLAAQNGGDFAGYKQLYAARFDGIKRSGPRIRRFDRDGWLADRARMFERPAAGTPMAVAVAEPQIQGGAGTARVRFVQTFSRGTFQDRGPKELVLTRESAGVRIAREEMLTSTTGKPAPASEMAAAEHGFFFVIDQGVVLSRQPGKGAARGAPRLLDESNEVFLVESAVDEKRLDEGARRWKGRKLRVFDETGARCVGTVGELALLVRVDPHFSTTQEWSGLASDDSGELVPSGKPHSQARIAREAWAMAEPILVGRLGGDCASVTGRPDATRWARDAELPEPALGAVTDDVDSALRAEAERQVRRHPAVAQAERAARTATDREEGTPEPTIRVFSIRGKETPSLLLATFESPGGCDDYVGMTFIWRPGGSGKRPKLQLLNDPEAGLFTPRAAFDLDGDGQLELLGEQGGIGIGSTDLLRPGSGYGDRESLEITSLDCYC
jgi:hypothetical protein